MTEEKSKMEKKLEQGIEKVEEAEAKTEHSHSHEGHDHGHDHTHAHEKTEEKPKTEKKEEKKVVKAKVKKNIATVTDENIPVSTKDCMAIGKFIRGKKIDVAIKELEEVVKIRRAVPMRGEIPHRHGDMMSGRYPKKAAENFIRLLKSLNANATYNGMENPIIFEIVSNIGSRPYGRFGAVRKKRTHLKIVSREARPKNKGAKKK